MYKVLVIEDDDSLTDVIKEYLQKYDYQVYTVEDFKCVEQKFEQVNPDLVLLDINLPYYDGFYLCRVFRRKSHIPILFISARNDDMDQIMAIEMGADDYVTKPFSGELLLAKVKAALRRTYGEYQAPREDEIRTHGLILDPSTFKLIYQGKKVDMTISEFKLVRKLMESAQQVVSREALLEALWDDAAFVDDNTLTVHVTRVKSKFKELGIRDILKTKRGAGYMLDLTEMGGKDYE